MQHMYISYIVYSKYPTTHSAAPDIMHICIHTYLHSYMHTYIPTDRQTDRQTEIDGRTDGQMDRCADRHGQDSLSNTVY